MEIEQKFLVRCEHLPRPLPKGKKIEQGYLSIEPMVRIRTVSGSSAYLTVKGKGFRERAEYEYKIPVKDARDLMKLCGARTLSKIRRCIGPWELDEFTGRHKGLWLAECELKSARSKLPSLPEWIGQEVTTDPKYANVNLAKVK